MKKKKRNYLLEATIDLFSRLPRGRVLDLGCGDGDYARRLQDLGFDVVAGDIDVKRFRHKDRIPFVACDITREMPFADHHFDYVLLMEVVEHLRNPYTVLAEINRIIRSTGSLVLSTPNILSLHSRFRYFFEGVYDFFREPPLDQTQNPKEVIFNLHIAPYRYHELEYLLSATGFKVGAIRASVLEGFWLAPWVPFIRFQSWQRQARSRRTGGIDYRRINKILLSKELLFGRHVILEAKKV